MFRKSSALILTLTLILYFSSSVPSYAITNFDICTSIIQPESTSKALEKNIIVSLLVPYLIKAFEERDISHEMFKLDDIIITSITKLPDDSIQIKLNIRTFPLQSYEPPYGIYDIIVNINGKSVTITDMKEY